MGLLNRKRGRRLAELGELAYGLMKDGELQAPALQRLFDDVEDISHVINYDVPNEVDEYKYRAELVGSGKAARMVSLVSKMDKDDIDEIVKKVGYAPTEIPLPEEVKEKKGRSKKRSGSNKKNHKKKNNQDRKRRKPKKEKKPNGLPRPSYEGLSGGKEGKKGKRPSPGSEDGAFGWIKKLFN